MSQEDQNNSLPTIEGLAKSRELFKNSIKKKPSDELVKIIQEITGEEQSETEDRAARPPESEMGL